MLSALLRAHHITLDPASPCALCEGGMTPDGPYDILIYFRKDRIERLLACLGAGGHNPSVLMGMGEGEFTPIELSRVAYFNAYGDDTFANTVDGERHRVRPKLYELEETLPRGFIRVNKSEIVNIKYILKIVPMFKGKLVLTMQGHREPIDVSRNYVRDFKERIGM